MSLICPHCHEPLESAERTLRCANNHSFDQARQGYWNLLLPQQKHSRDPGDNAEMIAARRDFLDRGFYAPLAQQVATKAAELTADTETPCLLDIGCGEGYYTARIAQALSDAHIYGLDISKHAAKAACRRSKEIDWLVASSAQIPLADHSCDLAVLIFSRLLPEEILRVLKPTGKLILVWPGTDHLLELRQRIYPQVNSHDSDPSSLLQENGFITAAIEPVTFELNLDTADKISALLEMTPHGKRSPREAREKLLAEGSLNVRCDFRMGIFQPRAE